MGQKGAATKEAIMKVAQDLILSKGFSGTSIDEIIAEVGITKGGFFYHFKSRNDLARQLMVRYLEEDDRILNELSDRAKSLTDDGLQQLLVFMKLYAEALEEMQGVHPGCLVASYTYEAQQFDPEILELTREGVRSWKALFMAQIEAALVEYEIHPPRSTEQIADMLNTILEGGILLSKLEGSNHVLVEQMLQFRDYLKLIFRRREEKGRATA